MPSRRPRRAEPLVRAFEDGDAEAAVRLVGPPYGSSRVLRRRWGGGDPNVRALVVEVAGEVVGLGTLRAPEASRARWVAEVGVTLHDKAPEAAGRALLEALIELGESWLGVLRMQTTVPVDDKRAIAILREHGFAIEGVARAAALRRGSLVDLFYAARVADDLPWPRITAEDVAQRPPPQLTSGAGGGANGPRNGNGNGNGGPQGFGWGFGRD